MKKILFAHTDAPDHFYPADEVVHKLVDNFVEGFHDLASLSVTFSDGSGLIFRIDTSADTLDPLGSSATNPYDVAEVIGTCVVTETPNGLEATLTIDPAKTEFINWIQSDSPPPDNFKEVLTSIRNQHQDVVLTISEDDFIVSPAVRNLTGGWSEEGGVDYNFDSVAFDVDHKQDYRFQNIDLPPDPGMTENLKPVPDPPRNWTNPVRKKWLGKYHDPY